MRVLAGRHQIDMTAVEFDELAARYEGVDLDIGTGDGGFVLNRAAARPNRLIVGLDPVAEAMADAASRITRRRTRLENVLFVVASVEQMPVELAGRCTRVFINLPWGSLMGGLILPAPEILKAIALPGEAGATYRIVLNLRVFEDPVPIEVRNLPEVTVDDARTRLAPHYAEAGLMVTSVDELGPSGLADLRSTWARRLSHRIAPHSLVICASKTN